MKIHSLISNSVLLSEVNGKFCKVEYSRFMKVKRKFADEFSSRLVKYTSYQGIRIGVSNETSINNQLDREHDPADYKAGPLKGKNWIYYPVLQRSEKDPSKLYFKFEGWGDHVNISSRYEFDGKKIDDLSKFTGILLASEYKKKQNSFPTKREKLYLSMAIDNIVSLSVNGKDYY